MILPAVRYIFMLMLYDGLTIVIVAVVMLKMLKDKAEAELSDTRRTETHAAHNYDMLKTFIENSIAAGELKATSEADLAVTAKNLAHLEVVGLIKSLARKHHSRSLDKLVSKC